MADNAYILTDGEQKIPYDDAEYKNGAILHGYVVINSIPFSFSIICNKDKGKQADAFDFICKTLSEITTE